MLNAWLFVLQVLLLKWVCMKAHECNIEPRDCVVLQVLHVEVSIEGSGMQYQPGDSIGVLPHNTPELVNGILQHLGQDGQQVFSVASSSGDGAVLLQHLHWPCSLEGALTAGCDLTSVPRLAFC